MGSPAASEKLVSGGEDSGIWKSTDGGDTWEKTSAATGPAPGNVYGKIGICASPASQIASQAVIERSRLPFRRRRQDLGDGLGHGRAQRRAWYYMHIIPDPVRRRHRLDHEPAVLEVGRRRQELTNPDAAQRQPRSLDRSRVTAAWSRATTAART
ncbi:MAG: hypothetical protein R2849_18780 [Thermomicrobiales bacterium]